jgi:putative phosphoribosyl transferase
VQVLPPPFADRRDAGRKLAARLAARGYADPYVLALPRGGVPVAAEIAQALGAPLDVLLVRKLGVPGHEELAMGAIADGGVRVLNDEVIAYAGVGGEALERVTRQEQRELARRAAAYRGERPFPRLADKTVIVVDDGLATGATMRAAVLALRELGAARIVVAVPVGAPSTCAALREIADEVVCVRMPARFGGVGSWYRDFSQTTDEEVQRALRAASGAAPSRDRDQDRAAGER